MVRELLCLRVGTANAGLTHNILIGLTKTEYGTNTGCPKDQKCQ